MTFVIAFPSIDPVLVEVGPFAIRWYALAYIAGILLGWRYARALMAGKTGKPTPTDIDDFIIWLTFGIILGGRLGYVLFYKFEYYTASPLEIFFVWRGGMSFHGGMLGVVVAMIAFAHSRGIGILRLADPFACAAPIGLFFGRIANFINGELFGRVSDVPWAVIFPYGGPQPRHPSQLYQAGLEGLALFVVLTILWRMTGAGRKSGFMTGAFLAGYGIFRVVGELFRQPDAHLGFLVGGTTMGQLLSLPMVVAGGWLIIRAKTTQLKARKR